MKAATVLAFGALALAAPTPDVEIGSKVPLLRRKAEHKLTSDGSVHFGWLKEHLKYTLLKYNKDFELPDFLLDIGNIEKRGTNANEPLTDQNDGGDDELYYGVGTVGAAQQRFTFDFDTGSSDTFIPGPSCGASQGCAGTTKYNQQGQDEHNTTSITYGSGAVQGENYFDSVTIAGLTANHQNVISLTTATGFSTSSSDGLMGMAFPAIASSKQLPYFFTLISQGKVNPTEFSFYLGRAKSNTAGNSEMTLGGRDSSKFTGATTPVPVTSQTYWQVAINGASVGTGSTIAGTSGQAAIDTGTTLVVAPTSAAAAIYNKIPGAFPIPFLGGTTQLYGYPCNSNPNVSLSFAGKQFAINNLDFNFGKLSDQLGPIGAFFPGSCLGGVAGADLATVSGQSLWIVGDTFLKNWYSTYQYVSPSSAFVNFAKAV